MKFGRTPGVIVWPETPMGQDGREILREIGVDEEEIGRLAATGVVAFPSG
jgi:crotonobetainyl-CoA:carnitine CoA-transferase CaiB-like acyl-CoA transferase